MMSAKEAKKQSDENSSKQEDNTNALLKAIDLKIQEATAFGLTSCSLTFPNSQVSSETLKQAEAKLKELGYKTSKSESYAYKTFTLGVGWN